jgi:hypothetical protein
MTMIVFTQPLRWLARAAERVVAVLASRASRRRLARAAEASVLELDLVRGLLLHGMQRKSVSTSKVNATPAVFRVLTQLVFNVIFGAVISFPHANPYRTMAMHAANGLVRCTHKRDRHLDPAPFAPGKGSKRKWLFLLALSHQVMMHGFSP